MKVWSLLWPWLTAAILAIGLSVDPNRIVPNYPKPTAPVERDRGLKDLAAWIACDQKHRSVSGDLWERDFECL